MKKLFIALLAALLLAFAACAAPQQETAAPEPAQSEPASAVSWNDLTFDRTLPLQYATQFSVSYAGEDYTRLTIGDDQTFLVVAGDAPVPDGVPAGCDRPDPAPFAHLSGRDRCDGLFPAAGRH